MIRSRNRLSSQVGRNDEKKKEGNKARCTDIVVPDTFPVISRSIACATQVERYKNSTCARRDVNALHSVRIEYVKQNKIVGTNGPVSFRV